MPPSSFLTSMPGGPFQPAENCRGISLNTDVYFSHHGVLEPGTFMVADATTKDSSAAVRIVFWRCQYCGLLLIGIGHQSGDIDAPPGYGIHAQEFTWLEEVKPAREQD
jgi:hypothetical protein